MFLKHSSPNYQFCDSVRGSMGNMECARSAWAIKSYSHQRNQILYKNEKFDTLGYTFISFLAKSEPR